MTKEVLIQQKWQKIWQDEKAFAANIDESKPKYYVLEMFPYPSGKVHVGHLRNYAIGDVIARFMKLKGYNVLHPMGWDAFGLPAENAAISNNSHPADWTYKNIKTMRSQLQAIGFSYDWKREFASCDPDYYKHEQLFFLQLLKKGLAYRKESIVNWDPVDQTVLANEQVVDGRGWRSGALVERRYLNQWFLKISNYTEELLSELNNLNDWPESVRLMQEKWIGKSHGVNFSFKVKNSRARIEVFSTKPETIFGAGFIGIAYNHPIIKELNADSVKKVKDFVEKCSHMSTSAASVEKAAKEGVFTGFYVTHPFDDSIELPVIIANFVLMEYGTGAVFGCPAHDERDHELAILMNLPIKQVITKAAANIDVKKAAYTEDGIMINSDFLNGLNSQDAKIKVIAEFERLGLGKSTINYRLKDWGISRQRFWGCPIPVVHCESCGIVPVNDRDLPITLPADIKLEGHGNPLDNHPTWKQVKCPKCQKPATRETDTFDTFFESSWYFTRFCNPEASKMTDKEACDYWLPVDQYIGGIEHAVLHLLYARFFTKAMNDLNYISVREPFKNLLTQGMVLHATYKDAEDNWLYPDEVVKQGDILVHKVTGAKVTEGKIEKMSKSKKNVIDLETMLKSHSADAVRMFVLSDSPPEKDLEWSSSGLEGCSKFITRLYKMADEIAKAKNSANINPGLKSLIHYTIKHTTDDISAFRLNKAIARIRELFNALSDELSKANADIDCVKEGYEALIRLGNPFIPHTSEEIWQKLGHTTRLYNNNWPTFDEALLVEQTYVMAIQINGKLRGTHEFAVNASDNEIRDTVFTLPFVQKYLTSSANTVVKKIIIVPKKIVNIVL